MWETVNLILHFMYNRDTLSRIHPTAPKITIINVIYEYSWSCEYTTFFILIWSITSDRYTLFNYLKKSP